MELDDLQLRTVYAKGFPLDSTLRQLVEFFLLNFESVEEISMRQIFCPQLQQLRFDGSIFVKFGRLEDAMVFVNRNEVIYKGKPLLLRYTKFEYVKTMKNEQAMMYQYGLIAKPAEEETAIEQDLKYSFAENAVVFFVVRDAAADKILKHKNIMARVNELDPSTDIALIRFRIGDNEGELWFSEENDVTNLVAKLKGGNVSGIEGNDRNITIFPAD